MSWRHPLPAMAPFGRRLLHGAREQEQRAIAELYPAERRRVHAEPAERSEATKPEPTR